MEDQNTKSVEEEAAKEPQAETSNEAAENAAPAEEAAEANAENKEETRDALTVAMREWEGHKRQWKSTIDEFELQLALGKAEAADKLEEWKESFMKFVAERRAQMGAENEGPDWNEVKGKFEHLEVQLALGKMELKEAYDEQKDLILEAIDNAKRSLKGVLGNIDDEFLEEAENFRAKLEGYQVQFALGKYEARDAIEEKKAELRQLVHDFRAKMESADEKTDEKDKLEGFMDEMGKSYEHLKSAFAGLWD